MAKLELLYQEKDTVLHSLDPRTKMLLTFFIVFLAIIWFDPLIQLFMLALAIALCLLAGLPIRRTFGIALGMLVFLALIGIIQILSRGAPYFMTIGPLKLSTPGLFYALSIGFRLAAMALTFSAFMACTRANLLTEALVKMRLPFQIAYMVTLALRFLPLFVVEMEIIQNAQQARAQEISKGVISKMKNLLTMIKPLFVGSLRRSSQIALSMELKAFGATKTRQRTPLFADLRLRTTDYTLIILGTLSFILLLFLTFSQKFGSLNTSLLSRFVR